MTTKSGSMPRHGKSFGKCSLCGKEFKLKKQHRHKGDRIITNVKCGDCSKKGVVS